MLARIFWILTLYSASLLTYVSACHKGVREDGRGVYMHDLGILSSYLRKITGIKFAICIDIICRLVYI